MEPSEALPEFPEVPAGPVWGALPLVLESDHPEFERLWRTEVISEYKHYRRGRHAGSRISKLVGFEVRTVDEFRMSQKVVFEPGECQYERFETHEEKQLRDLEAIRVERAGRGAAFVGKWKSKWLSLKKKVKGERIGCTVVHMSSGLIETSVDCATYKGNRARCERRIAAQLILMERASEGDPRVEIQEES